MCGIVGICFPGHDRPPNETLVRRMASRLAHRGPDEEGFYIAPGIGLGHRRLSIIDLSGGKQPMGNEDGTVWVVFNGEIFNYIELREMLEKKGHRFRTRSDTETIVHCYEEFGPDFCTHLNGQFAIALWDGNRRRLVLSRDRVGIRPLYYSRAPDGGMVFGSEMKALFAYPGITPRLDPAGLDQVFSLWATLPPRTVFKGIHEVPSGSVMVLDHNGTHTEKYWKLTFPRQGEYEYRSPEYYARELSESIHDSVKLRLRADVTVASYLSGGIDSSIIASLVKKHHNRDLITFSVCFADGQFDERQYQQMMVEQLNTDHRRIEITCDNIAQGYASVVRHAEMPMMRTAPAPLFQLSRLVRDNGIKVVLTGEGADEIFAGYNIFKEDRIRRFWARQPTSSFRPLLLSRIYPYVKNQGGAFWQAFFRNGLEDIDNPYYSHQIRWNNTAHIKRLLGNHVRADMNETANVTEPLSEHVDPEILSWHPLCRAQYLETCIFMSGYLLSAQGDRMMMGNSVEGRFPFLDHRVIELAARIPPEYKLKGLNEKHILKEAFKADLPEGVLNRSKQPYRAPISSCFINGGSGMAARVLEPDALTAGECFDPGRVSMLLKRLRASPVDRISARDDMAVAALVSTQLLTHHFISPLVEA